MTALEGLRDQSGPTPTTSGVRRQLIVLVAVAVLVAMGVVAWVLEASAIDHWLAIHTGIDDLSGPWYGFWSGIGSDLAELGLIGAVATGVYQLVRRYNCHEPRCWRVGTHPAADGQFVLCYRHHPDFNAKRPTHETIERLHRQRLGRLAALQDKIEELHGHATGGRAPSDRPEEAVGASDRNGSPGSSGEPAASVPMDSPSRRSTPTPLT